MLEVKEVKYGTEEWELAVAEERARLTDIHGIVWDTNEVQKAFDIVGFLAPQVAAVHRESGVKGSLFFQHSPRFYFNFIPQDATLYALLVDKTKIEIHQL